MIRIIFAHLSFRLEWYTCKITWKAKWDHTGSQVRVVVGGGAIATLKYLNSESNLSSSGKPRNIEFYEQKYLSSYSESL